MVHYLSKNYQLVFSKLFSKRFSMSDDHLALEDDPSETSTFKEVRIDIDPEERMASYEPSSARFHPAVAIVHPTRQSAVPSAAVLSSDGNLFDFLDDGGETAIIQRRQNSEDGDDEIEYLSDSGAVGHKFCGRQIPRERYKTVVGFTFFEFLERMSSIRLSITGGSSWDSCVPTIWCIL